MRVSRHQAYTNFLDFALMAFDPTRRQDAKENYKNDWRVLLEMFTIMGELSDNNGRGFADPLGEFYMKEITHGYNGQYFTPEPVCDMLAMMQGEPYDLQRVADPACGSGRTLLAMAKRNRNLLFYGADNDHTCAKMTVLNFLFNSMCGEVAHMNSISNEFYCGYKTGTLLGEDNMYHPYYVKFTDPNESYIWLRPPTPKESPQKASLTKDTPSAGGKHGTLF